MHVGFLGLGAMGGPMAAHLARRGPLTVWNRTAARAAAFAAETGARVAPTPRALAADVDVVITCLPSSREVEALLDGPDGLLAETGVAGPLLEQAGSRLGAARAELGEAADYLEPIRLNERQAGIEIRG